MAKITALTADAAVLDTDVTVTVEDPGGTPVTKTATWATIGVLFAARSETLTNKTINGASNTLTVRLANDITGFGANVAAALATFSSANIAAACTDETGTGALVFATSPTLTTPKIADSSGGQTYNVVVSDLAANRNVTLPLLGADDTFVFAAFAQTLTNKTIDLANNTLAFTSAQLAAACTNETGSGSLVFGTSPTLTTPQVNGGRIEATTFRWDGETTNASTGTLNNVSLGGNRILRFTHASGATITGFDATGVEDGEALLVRSIGNVLTLNHEDAGSSAGNRMTLPGAVARSQSGSVVGIFIYDATAARWFMPSGWYVA